MLLLSISSLAITALKSNRIRLTFSTNNVAGSGHQVQPFLLTKFFAILAIG
jgi:hypothetical protein